MFAKILGSRSDNNSKNQRYKQAQLRWTSRIYHESWIDDEEKEYEDEKKGKTLAHQASVTMDNSEEKSCDDEEIAPLKKATESHQEEEIISRKKVSLREILAKRE